MQKVMLLKFGYVLHLYAFRNRPLWHCKRDSRGSNPLCNTNYVFHPYMTWQDSQFTPYHQVKLRLEYLWKFEMICSRYLENEEVNKYLVTWMFVKRNCKLFRTFTKEKERGQRSNKTSHFTHTKQNWPTCSSKYNWAQKRGQEFKVSKTIEAIRDF